MTKHQQDIIGPGSEVGEQLLDIRAGVEFPEGGGFDPRGEKQRPAFERTGYRPKACSIDQVLELWAAHEGGSLLRVLHVPSKGDDATGEDDARRAWEWVANTPGYNRTVHQVLKHLVLRSRSWSEWPRDPAVKCNRIETASGVVHAPFCDWPFVTYDAAGAAWMPFFRALRRRYRLEPFTVFAQTVELA